MSRTYPVTQRLCLAVIADAPAARGDRNIMPKTAGRDANDVRRVARTDDGFGTAVMQLPVQHRTVPKEIPQFCRTGAG
jgi:hypothetical protein